MLQETAVVFPQTSFRWLLNGAGQIVDPFDYEIWNAVPVHQGVNAPLINPSHAAYPLVAGDQVLANGFQANRLALAINALPHNNDLQISQPQVNHYKATLHTIAEAFMNIAGASVPVSQSGANAVAGTLGAGPCVAVVARATGHGVPPAVACLHLSSNDMESLPDAYQAITDLHTQLVHQLAVPPVTCWCYLAGGSTIGDPDVIEEYARAFAACQQAQANLGMTLAGAVLPAAQQAGDYVDIFITPNSVYYVVDNNASSSDEDSTQEDSSSSEHD
jgi:hypothetical protein